MRAGVAHHAAVFPLTVRARVALHTVAFPLAVRAGGAHHAVLFQIAVGAGAAVHALAFQLAVGARVAVRAAAFHLAVRAGGAVHATAFQPAVRAALALHAALFHLAVRTRVTLPAVGLLLSVRASLHSHRSRATTPRVHSLLRKARRGRCFIVRVFQTARFFLASFMPKAPSSCVFKSLSRHDAPAVHSRPDPTRLMEGKPYTLCVRFPRILAAVSRTRARTSRGSTTRAKN